MNTAAACITQDTTVIINSKNITSTTTVYYTVTELIEKDPSQPVISESINVASKKYDIRIVIVDGNGTQIYDTGGAK